MQEIECFYEIIDGDALQNAERFPFSWKFER